MQVDKRKLTPAKAVKTAGNEVALAAALGLHPQTVRTWVKTKDYIPEEYALILVNICFREKFGLPPLPEIK